MSGYLIAPDGSKAEIKDTYARNEITSSKQELTQIKQDLSDEETNRKDADDLLNQAISLLQEAIKLKQDTLTDEQKQAIADLHSDTVKDVQIGGTSILDNDVANIPLSGTTGLAGVVRVINSYGLNNYGDGNLGLVRFSDTELKKRSANDLKPILLGNMDKTIKASLSDGNTLVTWTADEQKAACSRMGAVYDGWETIADVTVAEGEGGTSVANYNIFTDENGIDFNEMYIIFFNGGNGSGGNNYIRLMVGSTIIQPRQQFYIDNSASVSVSHLINTDAGCIIQTISTSNGYGTSVKSGFYVSKLSGITRVFITMNGTNACIGDGTQFKVIKR